MTFKIPFLLLTLALAAGAQQSAPPTPAQQNVPTIRETIEVTATRTPEDPEKVPTAIQVFSGDELAERGATDLRSALALATGVSIAPGGDAGPASAVPAFWGLQEFDAFLLVVDGIPWGGTFNPAITALNLSDVERIEVLRGPAPITYGATSFVGVIQVVNKDVQSTDRSLELYGGSFYSGGGAFSTPVPLTDNWNSRLTLEANRQGFSDDYANFARGHVLWRVARTPKNDNHLWFNADMNYLHQSPVSPRPRDGLVFAPDVPIDSNQNPAGAFVDDHRFTFMGGFDRKAGSSQWFTTISVSPDWQNIFRGFLVDNPVPGGDSPSRRLVTQQEDEAGTSPAHGFRENIQYLDTYADSHFLWKVAPSVHFIAGGDYMHGSGNAQGADFDYTALLDGPPGFVPKPDELDFHINDYRDFFGFYGMTEWTPFERLRIDAGIRLNVTREDQTVIDGGEGTSFSQTQTNVKPGANFGIMFTPWSSGDDSVGVYANYRYTFKPAAIDFGIGESEGGPLILKPETANSVEGGIKGVFLDHRVQLEASGFWMDFANLVVPADINGVPGLINAGKERFTGFESEASFLLHRDVIARATYSFHNAIFTDFVQDFDGVPTQLSGNRIEMSPQNIAGFGLLYAPVHGLTANVDFIYTGGRYLDKRNRVLAEGFGDVGVGLGYRTPRWELRVDARNLADRRDPLAESELGDAQYYLLPARTVSSTLRFHF